MLYQHKDKGIHFHSNKHSVTVTNVTVNIYMGWRGWVMICTFTENHLSICFSLFSTLGVCNKQVSVERGSTVLHYVSSSKFAFMFFNCCPNSI